MTKLAIAVVAIALPDAVNPSLILAALYLAAGSRRTRRTTVFTTAAFAITLAGGILIAFGVRDVLLGLLPKLTATVKFTGVTVLGFGLTAGGVAIGLRRDALSERELLRAEKISGGGRSAALLGAGIAGVELLTAFPYFAAIALVAGSSASIQEKLFLLVLYNVIYVLPLIAIVVVCLSMRDRADEVLTRVRGWSLAHWPTIVAPLAIAVGLALTVYGIVRLA